MTSSNRQKWKWILEHLIFPLAIAFGVVWLNNFYQEKKQPNLVAQAREYHVTEISDNTFKIECPFELLNNGG